MMTFSKQSGEWATGLKHNLFLQARLKLTFLYTLIIAVIIGAFSLFLYYNIASNLTDSSEETFSSNQSQLHFINSATEHVRNTLLFTDLGILVIAAALSYLLAGRTLRPIQRSLESRKKFAEDASHELRTPLAVMKSDCEVALRSDFFPKEVSQGILRSNLEEIDKMSAMVSDLLLLARADNNVRASSFEMLDVSKVIKDTCLKMMRLAKHKGINIVASKNTAANIKGDSILVERVLVNILQNAIDHTPAGGSVSVGVSRDATSVIIRIEDTGEGIDAKHIPHVFERFYKAESSRTGNGSGLGLSIVREIMTMHGGTVSLSSVKGKGTTVTLVFPAVDK